LLNAGGLSNTADMYGPFTNEKLVGRAIADRRDEVALATQHANERRKDGSFVGVNGKPEYVRSACSMNWPPREQRPETATPNMSTIDA
jgi:aryl-alcohol dehydrogenase-like predicted oxidoreductase